MSDDDPDVDTNPASVDPSSVDAADDLSVEPDSANCDCFAPPEVPCECYCLHCRRTFMSSAMWFQRIRTPRGEPLDGFWMCPTPNCDGKGFTFDIFPTDPDHPANEGWFSCDDEDEEELWLDEADDDDLPAGTDAEYDPSEPQYQQLDELGAEEDDLEGEEWKYGLEPGERLGSGAGEWAQVLFDELAEESRYDAPDERPREIVWEEPPPGAGGSLNEDDIPF